MLFKSSYVKELKKQNDKFFCMLCDLRTDMDGICGRINNLAGAQVNDHNFLYDLAKKIDNLLAPGARGPVDTRREIDLEEENMRLKEKIASLHRVISYMTAPHEGGILAMAGSITKTLRKDKDRLDWLEGNAHSVCRTYGHRGKDWCIIPLSVEKKYFGAHLREAIDAAMGSNNKPNKEGEKK